jgi:hypothetical protein
VISDKKEVLSSLITYYLSPITALRERSSGLPDDGSDGLLPTFIILPTLLEVASFLTLVRSQRGSLLSLLVTPIAAVAVDFASVTPLCIVNAPLSALMAHQLAP